ncbi:hypothetical protein [Streptomyces chromofuscus]|uniref:Uncharacterized protein n=1 Tax=Streptomyces chromofuscus TaxID=42881 RepID=A0A7M2T6X3_STRCW|nr:hypothetical protein [Streptomyces chromofuscus]QOV44332.1 hypothetical protein IPT68_32690 [Streptomyces chromofuscus]
MSPFLPTRTLTEDLTTDAVTAGVPVAADAAPPTGGARSRHRADVASTEKRHA